MIKSTDGTSVSLTFPDDAEKAMAKKISKGRPILEISKNVPNARPHFHDIQRIAGHIFFKT
jgi:hypothetical protein